MADRYVRIMSLLSSLLRSRLQIKNYVALAHVLAKVDRAPLGFSHIKIVVRANGLTVPDLDAGGDNNASNDRSLYED
jgi:hypothetical protein